MARIPTDPSTSEPASCIMGLTLVDRRTSRAFMQVVVSPLDRVLDVRAGSNLLEVLLERQIPVSYSCMAGRCGTCRCKILKGNVLASGHESRTPLIGSDGYVLACQTVLTEDCTVEIPEPDEIVVHRACALKGRVLSLKDLTHDVKQLQVQISKAMSYSPGQYAQVSFGDGLMRPYSMAGLGTDGILEFHIRLVPNGRVTQHIVRHVKPGDGVRITGPLGTSYLRRKHSGPILCVAGSTGLAPILAVIRGAVEAQMRNPIRLYFGARTPQDLYGLEWLRALAAAHQGLRFEAVVTTGGPDWRGRTGLVTDAVGTDRCDLRSARAYVCGPPAMVEVATLVLRQRGIPREHVYADAFYPTGT